MDLQKRSHDLQKVRYNGKWKENNKPATSRHKANDSPLSECDTSLANIPIIRQVDNARLLPKYVAVLGRNFEDGISRESNDGVKMEDLDQLQQDLEKLLSTCAVRHRMLRNEIENIDQKEERRENKKGKLIEKQPPLKRKRTDERIKHREAKNGIRILKPKYSLTLHGGVTDLQHKEEIPKVTIPKNDTSDKFWLSVDPYCADVTKDDVAFLDELMEETNRLMEIKIPEIGSHYTLEWSDDMLNLEQSISSGMRNTKCKPVTLNHELKKNGLNAMVETFSCNPLSQRLLAALIEEKVITKLPTINDKSKNLLDTNTYSLNNKSPNTPGTCFEKKKCQDMEHMIPDIRLHDIFPDDDILHEIKKCQKELAAVNARNLAQIKKLHAIIEKDFRRQEVKAELDKIDNQVLEMYNKILVAKQKQLTAATDQEEVFDKALFHKHHSKEFENEAHEIIKKQMALIEEFIELSNLSFH